MEHDHVYRQRGQARLMQSLGPQITAALADPAVTEIMLNDDGALFIENHHGMQRAGSMDAFAAEAVLRTLASLLGRRLNPAQPVLSGELPHSGARFEGLLPPLVRAPCFALRRHCALSMSLDALADSGMLNQEQISLLRQALQRRRSILIAGGTGSGKTTLLNALLNELSLLCPNDRILSIEDTPELKLMNHNCLSLFTSEHTGMEILVRSALRLRPDRIVVGEVRGAEALDLIDALSTGHEGGLATIHAGSQAQALKRMTLLVSRHPRAPRLIEPTIAEALDLIVQLHRRPQRRISAISKVTGWDQEGFKLQTAEVHP